MAKKPTKKRSTVGRGKRRRKAPSSSARKKPGAVARRKKGKKSTTRRAPRPRPELSVTAYFKTGVGKKARWWIRFPAEYGRPAQTVKLPAGERPFGYYYHLIRKGPAKGAVVARDADTGRVIPKGKLPRREASVDYAVKSMRAHVKDATGFSWSSRFHVPVWRGWHSEFRFKPRPGDEYASWQQMADWFAAMHADENLKITLNHGIEPDARSERLHFGFLYAPGPDAAVDYQAGIRTAFAENAFHGLAAKCKEWAERYRDGRIVEIILSLQKPYARAAMKDSTFRAMTEATRKKLTEGKP
jgi:hypothetical protein